MGAYSLISREVSDWHSYGGNTAKANMLYFKAYPFLGTYTDFFVRFLVRYDVNGRWEQRIGCVQLTRQFIASLARKIIDDSMPNNPEKLVVNSPNGRMVVPKIWELQKEVERQGYNFTHIADACGDPNLWEVRVVKKNYPLVYQYRHEDNIYHRRSWQR